MGTLLVAPNLFYAFDYFATVYTNVLYDELKIAVEFIPFQCVLLTITDSKKREVKFA